MKRNCFAAEKGRGWVGRKKPRLLSETLFHILRLKCLVSSLNLVFDPEVVKGFYASGGFVGYVKLASTSFYDDSK